MQRILEFGDDAASTRRFGLLYEGFVIGGALIGAAADRGQGEKKTFDVVRRESKVLRKLKAMSAENGSDPLPTGEPNRTLAKPGTLVLEQAEHDLLKKYAEACRWKVSQTDDVVDAVDFLMAAGQQEDE